MHADMYALAQHTHAQSHTYTHSFSHTDMHIHTHTHSYTHKFSHTHTYSHSHMFSHSTHRHALSLSQHIHTWVIGFGWMDAITPKSSHTRSKIYLLIQTWSPPRMPTHGPTCDGAGEKQCENMKIKDYDVCGWRGRDDRIERDRSIRMMWHSAI